MGFQGALEALRVRFGCFRSSRAPPEAPKAQRSHDLARKNAQNQRFCIWQKPASARHAKRGKCDLQGSERRCRGVKTACGSRQRSRAHTVGTASAHGNTWFYKYHHFFSIDEILEFSTPLRPTSPDIAESKQSIPSATRNASFRVQNNDFRFASKIPIFVNLHSAQCSLLVSELKYLEYRKFNEHWAPQGVDAKPRGALHHTAAFSTKTQTCNI